MEVYPEKMASNKVLLPLSPVTRRLPRTVKCSSSFSIFRRSVLLIFCKPMFWCRFFCQPVVRPSPSRFVSLARNCQVSQCDASQEFVVSTAHWMFLKAYNLATAFHDVFGYGKTVSVRLCPCLLLDPPRIRDIATPRTCLLTIHVRVQEEDETSLPKKIPPNFSFYRCTGWTRPHTRDRCLRSTTVARIVRRACLTEVLYGNTSFETRASATVFLPGLE